MAQLKEKTISNFMVKAATQHPIILCLGGTQQTDLFREETAKYLASIKNRAYKVIQAQTIEEANDPMDTPQKPDLIIITDPVLFERNKDRILCGESDPEDFIVQLRNSGHAMPVIILAQSPESLAERNALLKAMPGDNSAVCLSSEPNLTSLIGIKIREYQEASTEHSGRS